MRYRLLYVLVIACALLAPTAAILLAQGAGAPGAVPVAAPVVAPPVAAPVAPPVVPPAMPPAAPDGAEKPLIETLPPPAPAPPLPRFGHDLFVGNTAVFLPAPDAPVLPDYKLGVGDTLSVVCWNGAAEYERTNVTIGPQGTVSLKLVGTVALGSITLVQARDLLTQQYSRFYKGFSLDVQVVRRRTVSVLVVGAVAKPGPYVLPSLSTVFSALASAGGPTEIGSLRHIRLDRRGKAVATIDVYDYLIHGTTVDVPLEPGDTVVVPVAAITVAVSGEVRRPAVYELRAGDTLGQTIGLAGGMTAETANRARLSRITPARDRVVQELALTDAALGQVMADGDELLVRRVLAAVRNAVTLAGAVNRPGPYPVDQAGTVGALLALAEGVQPEAYLEQAVIERQDPRTGERSQVPVNLRLASAGLGDVALKAGDTLRVFFRRELTQLLDTVWVRGEVVKPGGFAWRPGLRLADLLELAFGPTTDAYLRQAHLYRYPTLGDNKLAQPELLTVDLAKVVARDAAANIELRPRDVLRVYARAELPELSDTVRVDGEVVRPGAYPYQPGMKVADLVQRAFGVTVGAYLPQAHLYRYPLDGLTPEHMQPQLIPIDLATALAGDAKANLALQPRDYLQIFPRKDLAELADVVRIDGEVVKPGIVPFQKGMTVADLVKRAFGVTADAYLTQVVVQRYPMGELPKMLTINLANALAGVPQDNVALEPRDRITVKARKDVTDLLVRVEGEVTTPGPIAYYDGMRVSDAIFQAGGLNANVAMDHAFIYRLNERTRADEMLDISLRGALARDPAHDVPLLNGDRLVIYSIDYMGLGRDVTVEGAVVTPGSYPYTGGMRVSHLLFLAKDLRADSYADRANLYRRRADNTVEILPVNLVAARTGVRDDTNPALQPRDRLVVFTRDDVADPQVVKIDGFVRKPGDFPLTVGMKLSDLLSLAGGLRENADPKVFIYRRDQTDPLAFEVALTGGLPSLKVDPLLQDRDLVSVRGNAMYAAMTETVAVRGSMRHPGTYPAYADGSRQKPKTLYQVLEEAGGLLPDAYPAGIVLYRAESATHTDEQRRELLKTLADLDTGMGLPVMSGAAEAKADPAKADATKDQNITALSRSMAQVMTTDKGSRVVLVIPPRAMQDQTARLTIPLNAEPLIASKGKTGDIVLQPGDIVVVPERPTTVTVLGGVFSGGSVVFEPGKDVAYYANACGGVARDGDIKRTVVMRMNGLVLPIAQVKAIQPGDIVIVPTKHMVETVNTASGWERILRTISETALSFLPFLR